MAITCSATFSKFPTCDRTPFGILAVRFAASGALTPMKNGPASAKEEFIGFYGMLAGLYSFWLLGFLLLALGAFLVRKYQGWGFITFAAFLALIFRRQLARWGRFLASLFNADKGMLRPGETLAEGWGIRRPSRRCVFTSSKPN
jgi:hypothetical protein